MPSARACKAGFSADLLGGCRLLDDFRLGAAQGGLLPRPELAVQLQVARRHEDALAFDLRAEGVLRFSQRRGEV